MSLGELGNNLLDVVESAVFGTANTSQETTSVNPLYDDEFFHPLVVHDDEPCKWILHHKIRHLHVKLWDLLIFVPCSIFFSFLVSGLTKTKQRIQGSTGTASLTVIYTVIFLTSFFGFTRALLNMVLSIEKENAQSERVLWVVNRLIYLAAELTILAISCSAKNRLGKIALLKLSLCMIFVACIFCGVQLYLELLKPYYGYRVIHNGDYLYGNGGPHYWTLTSGLTSIIYLTMICLPSLTTKQMIVSSSTLFYSYMGGQLLLNVITCLGALLLSWNEHSGMCATDVTSYIYFSFLPVAAYLCFVRPSLKIVRPNHLFSYTSQIDEGAEDSVLSCSGSVQSFAGQESAIIKPEAVNSTLFSTGLQSPDTIDDRDLLIQ